MSNIIRIGTRGSTLAMWQAHFVKQQLQGAHPNLMVEINPIKTTGDIIQDVALARLEGKAFFTKEIEDALLTAEVDIAVHSGKDVPTEQPEGLIISGFLKRHTPNDAWISASGLPLDSLPVGASVGTSSLRRRALVANLRPDLTVVDLRGNVDTRLKKIKNGEYDAIILAAAGLERLALLHKATEMLDVTHFPPSVAQGAIAIEQRLNDDRVTALLATVLDTSTTCMVQAERALLAALEGGCQVPLGALATIEKNQLTLNASLLSLDGKQRINGRLDGPLNNPETLGIAMAKHLLNSGGGPILQTIRRQ